MRFINKQKFIILSIVLIILLFSGSAIEASTQIRAGSLDYKENWIDLRDGVTIFWQEYEITSERGEIDREESITYLYENIEVTFDRGWITSDELVIYSERDELVFTDNVFLNYQRETEDEDDETLELTTSKLVYNTEAETFEMEEDLEIRQANRTIKAGAGTYSEGEDVFYLRSGVEIIEDDGDKIKSDTARIDLSEGDVFTAEGNVEIEIDM